MNTLPGLEAAPAKVKVLRMMADHQRRIIAGAKCTTLRRSSLKQQLYRMEGGINPHTQQPVSLGYVRITQQPVELWHGKGHHLTTNGDRTEVFALSWERLLELEGYKDGQSRFMNLMFEWHPGWLSGEYQLWLHWLEFAGETL